MDEWQKGLVEILIAAGKAVSEKGAVEGATRLFNKLKAVLRRDHGIKAVDQLGATAPAASVVAELNAQVKAAPAVLESAEVKQILRELLQASPPLVDLVEVSAHGNLLVRRIGGAVRIHRAQAAGDVVVEDVSRSSPPGN